MRDQDGMVWVAVAEVKQESVKSMWELEWLGPVLESSAVAPLTLMMGRK